MPNSTGWSRIEKFVGYGHRRAPVVFVGMEEGLSKPEQLNDQLEARARFERVMDLKAAHDGIPGTEDFFDAQDPKCQRTWRPMCDLMLRREGTSPTLRDRNLYQASRLGSDKGDTLLMELLPYPNVRSDRWAYRSRYVDRNEYEKEMLVARLDLLRDEIASERRELVVCYGKRRWAEFKSLMASTFNLHAADWRQRQDGNVQVATSGNTRIVLSCHLSSHHFNSERQLAAFARVALA
jgi:hypothetical protein